ncbi:hypothetical protein ACFQX8_05845 [Klenkia terrae]|uniref:hypothetical protein n=1 Tax=Klenkia terrae TaxID=1052259 RepID=UPI003617C7FA
MEKGTTRNLHIGSQFQVRFKLHDSAGGVVSYPTQTALDFWAEPPATLPSMECVNLAVGYEWDKNLGSMGRAVMSLHVSMDKPLWVIELPRIGGEGSGDISVIQGPVDGPQLPTIVMPSAPAREIGRG